MLVQAIGILVLIIVLVLVLSLATRRSLADPSGRSTLALGVICLAFAAAALIVPSDGDQFLTNIGFGLGGAFTVTGFMDITYGLQQMRNARAEASRDRE